MTQVTIHEVARRAGVAASTVSRSFTAPGLVRSSTRERVLRIAGELGYRPNRAARSLITGRTGNLGIVVPDLANPFFAAVVKGAQARAREADYAVFLGDSDEDPAIERELVDAIGREVDGMIVCSSRLEGGGHTTVAAGAPTVLLNARQEGIPSVLLDSAGGARQAIEHLAALGHRSCAFLSGPKASWSNRERVRGLRAAARAAGLQLVELGPFPPHFEGGLQAADVALAAGVSAVIAFNDLMALGVLNRLDQRGVMVPGELSVIGFDGIPLGAMTTPSLTSVSMPTATAGRAAVELLLARIGAPQLDARGSDRADGQTRRLATELIVRGSTAPPRATGSVESAAPAGRRRTLGAAR